MIDFSRSFSTAWERTRVILFEPFDFGKWCAIGLSAFLAGLLQGGNGLNNFPNLNGLGDQNKFGGTTGTHRPSVDMHQLNAEASKFFSGMQLGMIILIGVVVFAVIIALGLLLYWLGTRGQFMFLDNVVRNRGAVAWPWSNYARLANSAFLMYVLFMVISLLVFVPIIIGVVVVCIPLFQHSRWPEGGEIGLLIGLGAAYLLGAFVVTVLLFLFREISIPIMFRQNITARPAFSQTMRLASQHTASIVVFVLLRFAIFWGVAIASALICCVTCCIGALPYIGTVLLLPVLVYVKCFSLECISQFGAEFDIWSVDARPAFTGQGMPPQQFIPPPQP